ncbi:MAG: hypothetical protein CMJ90_10860, partial [Planctomycetes bacterium]|nr:hypothetical protein [Planctomycetota bacterium]
MKRIRKQPRQGVVLIVVLVFVLLMGLAAYSYLLSMQIENLASKASADQAISQQAASSGIELLAAVLELPRKRRQELGGIYDNAALFANVKLFDELEEDMAEAPWFMVTVSRRKGTADEPWVFGATDESSKIHLAKLIEWDQ